MVRQDSLLSAVLSASLVCVEVTEAVRSGSSVAAQLWSHGSQRCEKNLWMTMDTCVHPVAHDNTSYVITGDIDAMWIRDSTAQLWPYVTLFETKREKTQWAPLSEEKEDDKALMELQELLHGAVKRQAHFQLTDPYANAFTNKWESETDRRLGRGGYVFTGNYEVDSGTYFMKFLTKLVHLQEKVDDASPTLMKDPQIRNAVAMLVGMYRQERDHAKGMSDYKYPLSAPWELPGPNGQGAPAEYTGMVWGAFRPSDDPQVYPYNIPNNIFLASVLGPLSELAEKHWEDSASLVADMRDLRQTIIDGVKAHGVNTEGGKSKYCYEVDGKGNCLMMDDANVPSLLSLPYLDPTHQTFDQELYKNTREFVLSEQNPWYFKGAQVAGIGSPHTGEDTIWPLSLVMQAMTTKDLDEKHAMIAALRVVDPHQKGLCESFHKNELSQITRAWFAWPNSLFAEFMMKEKDGSCNPSLAQLRQHLPQQNKSVSLTRVSHNVALSQKGMAEAGRQLSSASLDQDRREGVVLPRAEYYEHLERL